MKNLDSHGLRVKKRLHLDDSGGEGRAPQSVPRCHGLLTEEKGRWRKTSAEESSESIERLQNCDIEMSSSTPPTAWFSEGLFSKP